MSPECTFRFGRNYGNAAIECLGLTKVAYEALRGRDAVLRELNIRIDEGMISITGPYARQFASMFAAFCMKVAGITGFRMVFHQSRITMNQAIGGE